MSGARSNLPAPVSGYPAFGAVHEAWPNEQLRNFAFDFTRICEKVICYDTAGATVEPLIFDETSEHYVKNPLSITDEKALEFQEKYDPRKFFRIFDLETLGVSVIEMDPSAQFARKVRTVWESQDFGAVETEVRNEAARKQPDTTLKMHFDTVRGVGHKLPKTHDVSDARQKLALFPDEDRSRDTIEVIGDEAEILSSALRRRLKQYALPTDIIPHLTFAVFRHLATPDQISLIRSSADNYVRRYPFAVRLDPLTIRHKMEARKTKTSKY